MAKKKVEDLNDLKEKWSQQKTKEQQREALKQAKRQRIMDALDRMVAEKAPKTLATLTQYSGITSWEASMIFDELYGCTISKWFKMNKVENPFSDEENYFDELGED